MLSVFYHIFYDSKIFSYQIVKLLKIIIMNTIKIETELVNIIQYSNFSTVGELKEILSKYPDNLNFGFRNQPFQNLNYIKNKDNSFESLCFQEPDELDNIIQKKLNPINIGITLIETQNIINTLTEH
jgi:hypothetical protein